MEGLNLNIEKPQWVMIQGDNEEKLKQIVEILLGNSKEGLIEYTFNGIAVSSFSQRQLAAFRKKETINIFHNTFLVENDTVERNFMLQLKFSGIYPTKAKRRVDQVINEYSLIDIRNKQISELSLLEKIKVRLIKAIIADPKLICGLWPSFEIKQVDLEEINQWIRRITNMGITVVFLLKNDQFIGYGDFVLSI